MPEIHITTKKSVTLQNDEHDPITLNGLHEFLNTAADLNLPGDTVVEFEWDVFGDKTTVDSMSITENTEEKK